MIPKGQRIVCLINNDTKMIHFISSPQKTDDLKFKINCDKILLIMVLIFQMSTTDAQSVFQKSYIGSRESIAYSIYADNSGFVIAGTTSDWGAGGKDVLLLKTDLSGNILWAKTIGGKGNDIAYSIKKTSEGGFIIVGSTSSYVSVPSDSSNFYIIKTDSSGNIEWTRAIGSYNTEVANDVIETYDHKYAIVGYTKSIGPGNEDVYFMELDSIGNFLWAYGMGSTGSDFGNSIIQTPSHDFIIVGSTTSFNAGGQIPYLIVVDESGIVLNQDPSYTFNLNTPVSTSKRYFTKIINGYFNDYAITGSDGLGDFGDAQHFILDIDQNYNINWMKKYPLNSGEGVATSIDKTADGGFVIGGTMGVDHPALIKVDAIGQFESNKFYPDINSPYNGKGLDVKQTSDGEIVLVGYRYNSSDTSVYLIKADVNLSSGCDEHDGFENPSMIMNPIADLRVTTYATGTNYIAVDSGTVAIPYPFMNIICIATGISQDQITNENLEIRQSDYNVDFLLNDAGDFIKSIIIFNVLGETLQTNNQDHYSVSTTSFPKGIYFYQVITDYNRFYSGKFIVK